MILVSIKASSGPSSADECAFQISRDFETIMVVGTDVEDSGRASNGTYPTSPPSSSSCGREYHSPWSTRGRLRRFRDLRPQMVM